MKTLRTLAILASLLAPVLVRADIVAENEPPKAEVKTDTKPEAKPEAKPAKTDSEGFVPVAPGEALGPGETLPAANLVGGAYGFILAAMVAWIASVAVRARRVEEEVAALRARIEKQGQAG